MRGTLMPGESLTVTYELIKEGEKSILVVRSIMPESEVDRFSWRLRKLLRQFFGIKEIKITVKNEQTPSD